MRTCYFAILLSCYLAILLPCYLAFLLSGSLTIRLSYYPAFLLSGFLTTWLSCYFALSDEPSALHGVPDDWDTGWESSEGGSRIDACPIYLVKRGGRPDSGPLWFIMDHVRDRDGYKMKLSISRHVGLFASRNLTPISLCELCSDPKAYAYYQSVVAMHFVLIETSVRLLLTSGANPIQCRQIQGSTQRKAQRQRN